MKTVDKKELCRILNVKPSTLKDIVKDKKLEQRLEKKGYKLVDKFKKGRFVYYNIELINVDKELYCNLIKTHYNTDKQDEFSKYFTKRKEYSNKEKAISVRKLEGYTGVSRKTISKWDKISVSEKVMKKDGYCYFKYISSINDVVEIDGEEFSEFWKAVDSSKRLTQYFKEAMEGKITMEKYNELHRLFLNDKAVEKGSLCFRIPFYKVNDKNKLCSTISKLIKNIYGF